MNLSLCDTESILEMLGISTPDFDRMLPGTSDRKVMMEAVSELSGLKDYALTHFPVEIQVSIIKTLLGDSYIPFLRNYLYEQCDKRTIRRCFRNYELSSRNRGNHDNLHSLYVVARMILLNPQIESVVTYNYDCFLSYAICHMLRNHSDFFTGEEIRFLRRRYGVGKKDWELGEITAAVDIGNENIDGSCVPDKAIRIYHVHGYIPSPDEQQYLKPPSIVLSIDEYFSLLNDTTCWNYITQVNSIMTTNCLFIGSSLTDLSTKRMLDLAERQPVRTNRYVLDAHAQASHGCLRSNPMDLLRRIKNQYLENLGLCVIDCSEGFHRLFSDIATITSLNRKKTH